MYQALYRKYRPQTFDDVVGQRSVTQTLKNQMVSSRLSHAYLFTGTRGTGKTSCARILAKAVNCEHPIDGNPCNSCAACTSIDAGSCIDVVELDAASNNSVDNVRSLRDEAIYTPAQVKMRVYIIDEVHMLSNSAFNALLKIIEEPPEHLLFILATTELHKVPVTILSRCQRFTFRRIMPEEIVSRLNYIAYQEGIELEPDGAAFLARLADGGMRDAVSLLDQCASAGGGNVSTEQICRTLGLAGTRKTAALMQAVAEQNAAAALKIFQEEYADGKDLGAMLNELCTVARDLLIVKTAPERGMNLISGICTEGELKSLLRQFSGGELLRISSVLRDTAAGFHSSANKRIDAELCIIRLCEPEASLDAQSISARLSRLEEKIKNGVFQAPAPPIQEEQELPPWEEEERPPLPEEPPPMQTPPPQPAQAVPSGFWPELVERLRTSLKPPASAMFTATESAPVMGYLQGDLLILEAKDDFTYGIVNKPNILQMATEKASALLSRKITAKLCLAGKQAQNNAGFDRLMDFSAAHPELVDIK